MDMNRFSASDAALEGFRLTRERPGTIATWIGIYAVGLVIIGWLMLASLDPHLMELARKGGFSQDDLEQISGMLADSMPAFLLVLVMVVALTSVLTAGIFRIVLRPEEKGFAHLRLGADELRLTAVNLVLFAIGMVCLTAGILAVTLAEQSGSSIGLVAAVVVALLTIWVGVRLCLATPMTFATRKIAIGPAWELTRGRFFPLFGMIVLAGIFYIMIVLLVNIIVAAVEAVAGGKVDLTDPAHLSPAAWVAVLAPLALNFILQVVQIVMIYSPFAVAYQQIHGDPPAR
jgi:hypothetical protein